MIVEIPYPALVKGATSRMKSEKMIFCLPSLLADVPEASSREAPVAFRIEPDSGEATEIRTWCGRTFKRSRRSVGDLADEAAARPSSGLFSGMYREMRAVVGHQADADETRPRRLYSLLRVWTAFDSDSPRDAALTDRQGAAGLEGLRTADGMDEWRDRAWRIVRGLLIVDGELWMECPEPCYRVTAGSGHVVAELHESDDMSPTGCAYRRFSADRKDDALACARRLNRNGFDARVEGSVEIVLPDACETDFLALDLEAAATMAVQLVENRVSRGSAFDSEFILKLPESLVEAWAPLRDLFKSGEGDRDEFARLLLAFVDMVDQGGEWWDECVFLDSDWIRDVANEWLARAAPSAGARTP